jgi:hypothetical protein
MKANEVIMTGRNRRRAPSVAASSKGTPFSFCSFCKFKRRSVVLIGLAAKNGILIERSSIKPARTIAMEDPTIPMVTDSKTDTGMV